MSDPLFEAIGLAVLHLLWQGVVVAAVLAIALRLLARSAANVRYVVAVAALAALVVLGVATAYRSYDPAAPLIGSAELSAEPIFVLSEAAPVEPGLFARAVAAVRLYSATIAFIWLAGVVLLTSRLALSWTRTRALVTAASPAAAEWQNVLARISSSMRLRRVIRLVESASVDVPSVIGFLKPVVLVPASSLSGLSTRQLEMILAHELAHIRRHDYLVNVMQSVAETLLFFHPATWWISNQIRIERENACDDLAVGTCGNAIEYARALTTLEELRARPALAVAASGGSLLDRVKRLVGHHDRRVNGWTAAAAALSFAVVMAITSLPLRADRDVPAPPPAPAAAEVEVVAAPAPAPAPAPARAAHPRPALAPAAPPGPDDDFDFDFELPEIPTPAIAPHPMPTPMVMPIVAGTPMPALAPMAIAMADFDIDLDFDDQQTADSDLSGRLTVDELIALKIHGITPEYIRDMRAIFGALRLKELTSLKAMGVTPQYVAEMRAAGVSITTAKEATSLRAFNVTPEMVRSLAAAGYANLTVRDLTRLAAAGVNADFIRDMSKYREKK